MDDVAAQLATPARPAASARRRLRCAWRLLPFAIIAAGLVVGYLSGLHHYVSLDYLAHAHADMRAAIAGREVLAAIAFAAFCLIVTSFGFPLPLVLALFGGLLFGWIAGGVLASVGATGGATFIYMALRTAFGPRLRRWIGRHSTQLARGFERDAFAYLLALRLAPFIPFAVLNIACTPFRIRISTYMLATFLGVLPLTLIFAGLGESIDEGFAEAAAEGRRLALSDLMTSEVWLGAAGLALVAVLPVIVKAVRAWR